MKNKKIALINIVILLVIFLPITIIGLVKHIQDSAVIENPNHDFFYDNSLWFYDAKDNLINTYKCKSSICELAKPIIDDDTYHINYYKDGVDDVIKYNGSSHTFINDNNVISLYDIRNGKSFINLKSIKTYNTTLDNNLYIVQNGINNLWGVIKIDNTGTNDFKNIIPLDYEFIGLKNKLTEDGKLDTETFIVSKNSMWYLINQTNTTMCQAIDMPLVDYSPNYIIGYRDEYMIFNYNGERLYEQYHIDSYTYADKYIGLIQDQTLYVYNNIELLKTYELSGDNNDISFTYSDNKLNISIGNLLLDSLNVS